MKLKSIATICLLLLCLVSPQVAQTTNIAPPSESERLNKLFVNYFEEFLKFYPLYATATGDHRYDDQFPNDISQDFRAREKMLYVKYLQEVSSIDRNALAGQDRLSYDTFRFQMQDAIEGSKHNDDLIPVNQFDFDQTNFFPLLASGKAFHPFKTVKNYDDFLGRIRGFSIWVETAIANMREGVKRGIVQPRVLMERKLPQIDALLVADIKQSLFYQPITEMPADFSPADKARLTASYTTAINETVYPSYRKLYDFIKTEYLPKTRQTVGRSALPGGKEQYAYLVKLWTTTNLTPDEIHRLGLSEVARIRGEMERVKTEVGFKSDLKAFFEFLRTDRQFYPFKTDEDVLTAYRAMEAKLQNTLPKYFGIIPKAKFEIRMMEKFNSQGASESYFPAAPDGSRPGVFYVPIPDPTKYQNIQMESIFLHETIPGHHYQISLQQEQKDLPKFRRFGGYGAYAEGWALYTESLGRELGFYTDPYQYFGMLTMEMHRAIRLVVDTGIHSKGWTREQAINYSLENEPSSEADITGEVERYIAIPGQALAYKIGQLKILELRRRAEKELGAKFMLKDFHDQILKDGALPLDVLEIKINEWIAKQRQRG